MEKSINWERVSRSAEASRLAYIDGKTAKTHYKNLGYTKHHYFDVDGAQAHVCENKQEILIACRGTQPTEINDLLADLNTIPKRHGPGFVHSGFRGEARKVYPKILDLVQKNHNKSILVTGHSLGAAMATYIAQELSWEGYADVELYTYGSPRLGSDDFADAMTVPHWRFVNNNDGVTHVPPALLGFKHHGELMYINYNGNIKKLSRWQRFVDGMRGWFSALRKLQLFDWLYDHSMEQYSKKIKKITKSH